MLNSINKIINLIKLLWIFLLVERYFTFERIMHMNRVLSVESVDWDVVNEKKKTPK